MKKNVTKVTISSARVFLTSGMVVGALLLSGCSLLQGPVPQHTRPAVSENQEPKPKGPREIIKMNPDGNAHDNLPAFNNALARLAESDKEFSRETIRESLSESGFDSKGVALSQDATVLGDASPTLFVGIQIKGECLVGQLVRDKRETVSSVMPPLGPKKDVCVIQNPHN